MGHVKVSNKTRKYMSVYGTLIVLGVTFFLGILVGFALGLNV